MKSFTVAKVILTVVVLQLVKEEVTGQAYHPAYGGVPIPYNNYEDDDLGLLLTVLLLATKNRSCKCCNCCGKCGGAAKSIPIPYPIPFPLNPPMMKSKSDDDNDDSDEKDDNKQSLDSKKKFSEDVSATLKFEPVPKDNYDDNSSNGSKDNSKQNQN